MAEVRITRGLRKLDFISADEESGATAHARVEFESASALPAGERVHISLGMRDGKLRALVGVPQLLQKKADGVRAEYLYRLSGQINEEPA